MFNFRNIAAREALFVKTRDKYGDSLEDFQRFAQMLTDNAGKAKLKSGKASSYARYLVRLIIFYTEAYEDILDDLTSFVAFKKIEMIKSAEGFKHFNQEANSFYSATLNCYLAYVTYKNSIDEEMIDEQFNHVLNGFEDTENIVEEEKAAYLINAPKIKPPKKNNSSSYSYPRNYTEALEAKKRNNWICEFNSKHETFINIKDGRTYVDAHHLIPMAAQDYFENTIDFADNIICLCPTCHSRIHHAIQQEKKEMIVKLFSKREDLYSNHGIKINEKLLLSFYGII